MKRSTLGLMALLAFVSYAPAKTMTADELRSDLLSALSLASETGLFIGQIESGRLLPHFQTAYADYLRGDVERQAKKLRGSQTDSGHTKPLALYIEQLDLLARELAIIRVQVADEKLAKTHQRVQAIRKTLAAAGFDQ